LYGTTVAGGVYGTIFKITPEGTLTTLHRFDSTDGEAPYGGLLQATDGSFYGTAEAGGSSGAGTIFRLSVGLGPFVKTLPHTGKMGAVIEILGTDLTGATGVSFNGEGAVFTVNATGTGISATVPAGATTGKIQVTAPGGTLFSGGPFIVLP